MKKSPPILVAMISILSLGVIAFTISLFLKTEPSDIKTLSNEHITIQIKEKGAELCSIVANRTNHEYLWQADTSFWGRQSPLLFPIVGNLWNNEFRHEGKTYTLPLHGFARDKDFKLIVDKPSEVLYRLESDEETLKMYPFSFYLDVGYRLKNNRIEVTWSVRNRGKDTMYFQIGAHPGFNYPDYKAENDPHGYLYLGVDPVNYRLVGSQGCLAPEKYAMQLKDGVLPLSADTFDKDALIFENNQLKTVVLLDRNRNPYLSLHCDAPVVGLWSPSGKNAPFVCIEPWFGRCDSIGYTEDFKNRVWMQALEPQAVFSTSYSIEIALNDPQ